MGCIPPSNITNLVKMRWKIWLKMKKEKNNMNEIFKNRNNNLQKKTNVLRYKMSCLKYTYALFKKGNKKK